MYQSEVSEETGNTPGVFNTGELIQGRDYTQVMKELRGQAGHDEETK